MTDAATTTLSVRGEARREVDPDSARLDLRVRTVAASKTEALQAVGAQARSVLAGLEQLGGAVLTAADERRDLGWVADGAITWQEHTWRKDQNVPTGRVGAVVAVHVTVRDFALVADVAEVLADHDLAHLDGVSWRVDADNAAWAQVRAEAIAAAVVKGRDYAAALGGALRHVEHVADAGLLGGRSSDAFFQQESAQPVSAAYRGGGGEDNSPPLDPTPQSVGAVIEARFTATVAPLS